MIYDCYHINNNYIVKELEMQYYFDCNYPDWVEDRGLEDEEWVQDRWCD